MHALDRRGRSFEVCLSFRTSGAYVSLEEHLAWERILNRIIGVAVLATLFILGFLRTRKRLRHVLERREFLDTFGSRFGQYIQSAGKDEKLYLELTERAGRMQREMGQAGVMAMYRPPYANYAFNDYQVIINMLPDYRHAANDWALHGLASQYAATIRDFLVRYSGTLKEIEDDVRQELRNPLIWLREGVRGVLASPINILMSLGIVPRSLGAGIIGSSLLRLVAGILAFITLVAALVQIITGWDATTAFLRNWLGRQ